MTNSNQQKNDTMSARTIMLIGRTGVGKSALANVITGTEKFSENAGSISETKSYQIEECLIDKKLYRIVDTIGIGDTSLTDRDVLFKLSMAAESIKYGLHQILFVINGSFTDAEINVYDGLKAVVFDNKVVDYTTIVRTKFPEFNNYASCKKDLENIVHGKYKISERVIHVDNPPLHYGDISRTNREQTRAIILKYLNDCNEIYYPINLVKLNEKIEKYMTEKERLQKEVENLKKQSAQSDKEKKKVEADLKKAQQKIVKLENNFICSCNIL